jgi:DDE superfamily endonuclease
VELSKLGNDTKMGKELMDIYSDYLIYQNKYATATGLSDLLPNDISHDQVTRLLNGSLLDSKALWQYIKAEVRRHEMKSGGVLILDDTIEEKPYTDENEIMCWHHCHTKNRHIKGVNILSCLVRYGDITFPVGYEIVHKDRQFSEVASKQLKRTTSITKNQHFRNLIEQCSKNQILFDYVLADNWFGAKENLDYIHHDLKKNFIIGLKANRTIALSESEKRAGKFQQVSALDMEDGQAKIVWLKGNSFPITLIKKVFKNEDDSIGTLYLASNDLSTDAQTLYHIYQKRWQIELYHKSIKQNASLAKSPTKRVRSQSNHIFASIMAFCKLQILQLATAANHFALKYKLLVISNLAAMKELQNLRSKSSTA